MIYEALAYAVVHCHLSPSEFARLTPEEWEAILALQMKERDEQIRTSWEQSRSIMYATVLPHLGQRMSARELFPFPWDSNLPPEESAPTDLLSEDELLEIQKRYQ